MSFDISPNIKQGFKDFLSDVRQGKDSVKSHAQIFQKIETQSLATDTTPLPVKVAAVIAKQLNPKESQVILSEHQQFASLSEEEKTKFKDKALHEKVIQNILQETLKKPVQSKKEYSSLIETAIKGVTDYCSSLVAISKRPQLRVQRKGPKAMEIETGKQAFMMEVEPEKQKTSKKRRLKEIGKPVEPSLPLKQRKTSQDLIDCFQKCGTSFDKIKDFIENQYPEFHSKGIYEVAPNKNLVEWLIDMCEISFLNYPEARNWYLTNYIDLIKNTTAKYPNLMEGQDEKIFKTIRMISTEIPDLANAFFDIFAPTLGKSRLDYNEKQLLECGLHLRCYLSNYEGMANLVLEKITSENCNERDLHGKTPLEYLISSLTKSKTPISSKLFSKILTKIGDIKADFSNEKLQPLSPFFPYLCQNVHLEGTSELIAKIISAHCAVDAIDDHGKTGFEYLNQAERLEILDCLIKLNPDIDRETIIKDFLALSFKKIDEKQALSELCTFVKYREVQEMVAEKLTSANCNSLDRAGWSPLANIFSWLPEGELPCENLTKKLQEVGAKVICTDTTNLTEIFPEACSREASLQTTPIIYEIIDSGCSLNEKDSSDKTGLEYILENRKGKIEETEKFVAEIYPKFQQKDSTLLCFLIDEANSAARAHLHRKAERYIALIKKVAMTYPSTLLDDLTIKDEKERYKKTVLHALVSANELDLAPLTDLFDFFIQEKAPFNQPIRLLYAIIDPQHNERNKALYFKVASHLLQQKKPLTTTAEIDSKNLSFKDCISTIFDAVDQESQIDTVKLLFSYDETEDRNNFISSKIAQSYLKAHLEPEKQKLLLSKWVDELKSQPNTTNIFVKLYCQLNRAAQKILLDTLYTFYPSSSPARKAFEILDQNFHEIQKDKNLETLYSNIDLLLPFLTNLEQSKYLDVFRQCLSYEQTEMQFFYFLKGILKNEFLGERPQEIQGKRLLSVIERMFPHSLELPKFILLFQQLYEKYRNIDTWIDNEFKNYAKNLGQKLEAAESDSIKKQFSKFINKQFSSLYESQFHTGDLAKTRQELGHLMYIIDQEPENLPAYLKKPDFPFIKTKLLKTEKPIFMDETFDVVSQEITLINHIVSALVRPDGTINTWLIQDLKALIENQTKAVGPESTRHMNKILDQIQDNDSICQLLSLSKVPTKKEGIDLVLATCNLTPHDKIDLSHVNKAICSAFLSPWRQYYFGSCHTTALLIALKDTATTAIIKDLQEIISSGTLTRQVANKLTDFRASFSLYPVLQNGISLADLADKTPKKIQKIVQRLCQEASLQLAWKLLKPNTQITLEQFLTEYVTKESHFTLHHIVEAMKPKEMKEEAFDLIVKYLNSRYQNPLLQCWQNGVMGMHGLPLNLEEELSLKFKTALCTTLHNIEKAESPLNTNFYAPSAFEEGRDAAIKTVQTLRFNLCPPQTMAQVLESSAIMNLCIHDAQNHFKPITSQEGFFSKLDAIYYDFRGKHIPLPGSEPERREKIKEIIKDFSEEMNLKKEETPWQFYARMSTCGSPLFSTYFKTKKEWVDIQRAKDEFALTFQGDLSKTVCAYRDWVLLQKANVPYLNGLRIPARIPDHLLNAIANEQIAKGSSYSTLWERRLRKETSKIQCRECDLRSIIINSEVIHERLWEAMKPQKNETLLHWYKRFGQRIIKAQSPNLAEIILFQQLINTSPNMRDKLLYKFADTNWSDVDKETGEVSFVYYAFALMPTCKGDLKWQLVKVKGNKIEELPAETLGKFEILKQAGPLIESTQNQRLLIAKQQMRDSVQTSIQKFAEFWKKQSENLLLDFRPQLKEVKVKFQEMINSFRTSYGLALNDELFATLPDPQGSSGALEALFSASDNDIDNLKPEPLLPLSTEKYPLRSHSTDDKTQIVDSQKRAL